MKICILSWLKKILTKKQSQESLEMKGDNYSMKYEKIEKDDEFFNWFGYAPTDAQYVRYSQEKPSVIAAGHKIEDVYYGFANARHSFMCAGLDNLGDVCGNDELSRTYAKSHFLSSLFSASGQTCGQVRKMGLFNPRSREEQAH